jgi:hypothetical protein
VPPRINSLFDTLEPFPSGRLIDVDTVVSDHQSPDPSCHDLEGLRKGTGQSQGLPNSQKLGGQPCVHTLPRYELIEDQSMIGCVCSATPTCGTAHNGGHRARPSPVSRYTCLFRGLGPQKATLSEHMWLSTSADNLGASWVSVPVHSKLEPQGWSRHSGATVGVLTMSLGKLATSNPTQAYYLGTFESKIFIRDPLRPFFDQVVQARFFVPQPCQRHS